MGLVTAVTAVPAVTPVPVMTVPTVGAGDGAVVKVRVVPAPKHGAPQMVAEPLPAAYVAGAVPGTHMVHAVHEAVLVV